MTAFISVSLMISKVSSVMDNNPEPVQTTWDAFVKAFKHPVIKGDLPLVQYLQAEKSVRDKQKDGKAIIPGTYSQPNTRNQDKLETLSLVTLDLDNGQHTFEGLCNLLEGLECFGHTSYSHSPDKPKFRVYVLLKNPITDDIKGTLGRIIDYFDDRIGGIDPACRKPGQLYFTPACPPGGEEYYQCRHISGTPLDPNDFPAPPEQDKLKPVSTPHSKPGDDFNKRADLHELLVQGGWAHSHRNHYRRPGKNHGVSGSILDSGFYCHSSAPEAAPFECGKCYSPFAVYALTQHNGDYSAAARELRAKGYGDQVPDLPPRFKGEGEHTKESTDDQFSPKPSLLRDMAQILLNPCEPEYLIDGILEKNTTNLLTGPSGSYKSFITDDILLSVTTNRPWAGHTIKQTGPVVLVAGEGRAGIPRRIQGWLNDRGTELPPNRFFITRASIELDPVGARQLTAEIEQIAQEHGNPVMLAVDTIARSLPCDSDENSAKDIMAFVSIIDQLRDKFGCVVLLVAHVGHGEETRLRARGSSALGAAMDSIIVVDPRRNCLIWTKTKDAPPPEPLPYSLRPCAPSAVIDYGTDAAPTTITSDKKLNKSEQLGLETLQKVCRDAGRDFASIMDWRFEYFRSHWADSADAKRKAFTRARETLVSTGLVHVEDDNYFLVTPDKTLNVRTCPDRYPGADRTDTDTLLKECPVVRPLVRSEVPTYTREDFMEVTA